ncbi:Hypothetical protein EHLA_3154 [Anaerobutyricum hallii]|uniref:Uncharacterized protein n=1 Tax=Anaerobutyricum hallii TaxID=39488 RepID=A0A285PWY3_9FIRM|nr:Hypothetical protein EHLA_3154 [Anaerobutyricum hallii]
MPVVFEKEMGKGTEGCGLFRYSLRQDCKFIIILSQYIIFFSGRYTFRASSRLLSSPPSLPKAYFVHSTWSQNTEKRNNIISQMRLRSVFKMRMSILNTATTEQMGYDIVSFFVYSPNESNRNKILFLFFLIDL